MGVIDNKVEDYTLVWMIFTPDMTLPLPSKTPGLSHPIDVEQHFPVYISGNELDVFNIDKTYALSPLNLLAGALLGCRYRPHLPLGDVRPFLSQYLERCAAERYDGKVDELVIQIASILRSKNGNLTSKLALSNALYLNANHNEILNDLMLDIWAIMSRTSDEDLGPLFQEIYNYTKKMVLEGMHPKAVEWHYYARAVTLAYLQIHHLKFDMDLFGSINQVKNEIARRKILESLQAFEFDRDLI